MIKELKKIGEELRNQDNRHTADVLFMVSTMKRIYGPSDCCNEAERREDDQDGMCEKCKEIENQNGEAPVYCDECDDDCFVYYNLERVTDDSAGCFLTAKACDEHIRINYYHYSDGKSYGVSAWRNPEMQLIRKYLMELK